MSDITIRELLEAGAHFGHQTRFWNPKMAPYIYGVKHKIHIINLEKMLPLYKDAINFLGSIASKRGKILFVGTKPSAQKIIKAEAERCGMPYVNHRWLGGMLTNYKTVRQSIKHFKEMEEKQSSEEFAKLSKKEALQYTRQLYKLEKSLKGIKDMAGLPDALFVIDVGQEKTAVTEANKLKIPVVGVVDTNRDPACVDYIIPANDDAEAAIRLYVKYVADAIIEARKDLPPEEEHTEKDQIKKVAKKPMRSKKKVFTRKAPAKFSEKEEEPGAKESKRRPHTTIKHRAPKISPSQASAEPESKEIEKKTESASSEPESQASAEEKNV